MATKRRSSGGGFKPSDLGGTLGTLIRSALSQASGVREKIDTYRSDQKRKDALAELGEIVLELVRRGEIDLGELPEAKEVIRFLDEVDETNTSHAQAHDQDHPSDPALPTSRSRFDTRSSDDTVSSARWTPPRAAPPERVWRPTSASSEPDPSARLVPLPKDPLRKGGISFDTDDDLASYMHPDDVPPKGGASDE